MSRSLRRAPVVDAAAVFDRPIFFDTNVLVYSYEPHDRARRERALAVIAEAMKTSRFVISAQVMQEFYNVVLRRRFLAPPDALAFLRLLADHTVVPANADSVLRALALQQRCRISVWDALVVQSALDAGCATLFSEDLQDGQRFETAGDRAASVTVVNPFASDAAGFGPAAYEPRRAYVVAPPRRKTQTSRNQP